MMSEKTHRNLDPIGGSDVGSRDGKVRIALWDDVQQPAEDPYAIWMTPGQALDLISKLAMAARNALKGSL